jgi:hypothetical protein
MALWEKVRHGIDKAGKVAQEAIDEGKLRLDAYRAREQADKAAEALGYAYFRAAENSQELESSARDRLTVALREREAEARRLEAELAAVRSGSGGATASSGAEPAPGPSPAAEPTAGPPPGPSPTADSSGTPGSQPPPSA